MEWRERAWHQAISVGQLMRLLFVTETIPFPPRNGKEVPTSHFIEGFSRSFEVDLLVVGPEGRNEFEARRHAVPESVRTVIFLDSARVGSARKVSEELVGRRPTFYLRGFDLGRTEAFLGSEKYDVIWVSPVGCMGLVEHCRVRGMLKEACVAIGLNDVKTTLYLDSVRELLKGRVALKLDRLARALRLPWIYGFERRYLRSADLVHVQTPVERARARRVLGGHADEVRIVAAANGRKEELFRSTPAGEESRDILYMTQLSGSRERESAWFLDEVWPRIRVADPAATLHLVGTPPAADSAFHDRKLDRVVVHGFVDDLGSIYSRIRVAVVPIVHSTGLINRVLDSLTAGVPVVGTPGPLATIPGMEVGRHALAAESAPAFAKQVLRLLHDPALWTRVSRAARMLGRQQATWDETVEKLVTALRETCRGGGDHVRS